MAGRVSDAGGAGEVPEFKEDADGFAEAVPANSTELAVAPGDLSKDYATYLKSGGDGFAPGANTSVWRAEREKDASRPGLATQYIDEPRTSGDYAPLALRTEDGGAMVFFTTHHYEKQTAAQGTAVPTPNKDVLALTTGEIKQSLTMQFVSNEVALDPAKAREPAGDDPGPDPGLGRISRERSSVRARGRLSLRASGTARRARPRSWSGSSPMYRRAGVGEDFQQGQRVGQRMLRPAHPRTDCLAGQPGGRNENVGPAAVPAQPRVLVRRLGVAVQLARPPLVLVLGGAAGEGEEEQPAVVALGDRPTSIPASSSRSSASRPASSGTSSTSWTMPVAVMKLACG